MQIVERKFIVKWPVLLFWRLYQSARVSIASYLHPSGRPRLTNWSDFRNWLTSMDSWHSRRYGFREPFTFRRKTIDWIIPALPYFDDYENVVSVNRYFAVPGCPPLGIIYKMCVSTNPSFVEVEFLRNHLDQYRRYVRSKNVINKVGSLFEYVYSGKSAIVNDLELDLRSILPGSVEIIKFRLVTPYLLSHQLFWVIEVYIGPNCPLITASIRVPYGYPLQLDSWIG